MAARKKQWVLQKQVTLPLESGDVMAWVDLPIPEGVEIKTATKAKSVLRKQEKGTKVRAVQVAVQGSMEEVPDVATRFVEG